MNKLITIGRQFGSGGAEVATKLGEKLGIKCYDKEILLEAAKKNGIFEGVAEQYDVDGHQSYFYSLAARGHVGNIIKEPVNAKFHKEQFQLMKNIAEEEGNGIFIGRCADYVLRDMDGLVKVYVTASLEERIQRIAEKYDKSEMDAYKLIQRRDSQREAYYNYYTNKKWADLNSYDLCVNISEVGIDGAVEMIINYINLKEQYKK